MGSRRSRNRAQAHAPLRVGVGWPRVALAATLALALLGGCGGEEQPAGSSSAPAPAAKPAPAAAAPAASAISLEEARRIFVERCSSCHGEQGRGDGPAAESLVPPPRNFHDPEWQASVTDEHISQVISYGGAAVGLSPIMPAQPDLANQPEALAGLVRYIRSLGQAR